MSMESIVQFREAVNANKDWQEEIRNFGDDDNMVDFAKGKGHVFTSEEYNQYVTESANGELSEFEMELVAGGTTFQDVYNKWSAVPRNISRG